MNELLRADPAARDEYILRIELHSRLASEPDLFASTQSHSSPLPAPEGTTPPQKIVTLQSSHDGRRKKIVWALALAACLVLIAAGWWGLRLARPTARGAATSKAVAMLSRTADARWDAHGEIPRLGSPVEPGWLRLEAGLAQIVFYSGARVVIEGPAEFQLISQNEASCRRGRVTAEVPSQAHGFRVGTAEATVTDLGASFGLEVKDRRTDLHVFKGKVTLHCAAHAADQILAEGTGALIETSAPPRLMPANAAAFASMFDFQARSVAAQTLRYGRWLSASEDLNHDPSLLIHFDFEHVAPSGWQLRNAGRQSAGAADATIIGCQWGEGRWPDKKALEFQGVSDRVRLGVPGEFQALTLSAWVCVKGLDRQINSLFMSDGFEAGTVHWVIRQDGVLGLTIVDADSGHHQIVASPPVLTLEKLGTWVHLAVVLDGSAKRVAHYLNGSQVSGKTLKIDPPFRVGNAELGNWNARGFPGNDPFMIRNFSGAMDEFCLFSRALDAREIRTLYSQGKPQGDAVAAH